MLKFFLLIFLYNAYGSTYCPDFSDSPFACGTLFGCQMRGDKCVKDYNNKSFCSQNKDCWNVTSQDYLYGCYFDHELAQCVGKPRIESCQDLDYTSAYECIEFGREKGCEWDRRKRLCQDYSNQLECPEPYVSDGRRCVQPAITCPQSYWNEGICEPYDDYRFIDRRTSVQRHCASLNTYQACSDDPRCRESRNFLCVAQQNQYNACEYGYELSRYGDCRTNTDLCSMQKNSYDCSQAGLNPICQWSYYVIAKRHELKSGKKVYYCKSRYPDGAYPRAKPRVRATPRPRVTPHPRQ